jgi:hypothetical protein
MNNYVTINETYYVSKNGLERGITDGVKENNGTEYNYQPSKDYDVKGADRIMIGKTAKHIDLCKQYSRHIRRTNNPETRFLINNIFNKYSEIIDAYEKIGMTGFINCSYQISKMKKEMNPKVSYDEKKHSISNHIKLKKGDWYSKTALKDMIQESYSLDDLKATAKATDIKLRYVTISRKGKCNDTNMRVNGFVMIGSNR